MPPMAEYLAEPLKSSVAGFASDLSDYMRRRPYPALEICVHKFYACSTVAPPNYHRFHHDFFFSSAAAISLRLS